MVHPVYLESEEGVDSFLGMMRQIGGARLLPRKERSQASHADEEDGDADEGDREEREEEEKTVVG